MSKEDEFGPFIENIADGEFNKVFEGEALERFYGFVNRRGRPKGGFLIAMPFEGGSLAWFFYEVDQDKSNERNTSVKVPPMVFLPANENELNRDVPEEVREKGYPIWWI